MNIYLFYFSLQLNGTIAAFNLTELSITFADIRLSPSFARHTGPALAAIWEGEQMRILLVVQIGIGVYLVASLVSWLCPVRFEVRHHMKIRISTKGHR